MFSTILINIIFGCILNEILNIRVRNMALYKDSSILKYVPNWDGWDKIYKPSDIVPHSGIYKCTGCKKEITSNKGDRFPPQNHHQHGSLLSSIQWKIIIYTDTDGSYNY